MSENSTIGFRIKQLRKELNLNQEDFVKDLGITRSALSQIESNAVNPSLELVNKIISVYKVSPTWVLVGTPDGYLNGYLNGYLDSKNFGENAQVDAPDIKKDRKYKPPDSSNEPVGQYFCDQCKRKQEIIEAQKELIDLLKDQISALKYKLNDTDQTDKNGQKRKAS